MSTGLTEKEVAQKIAQGKVNAPSKKRQGSTGQIVLRNTLTIFNLVNLVLAVLILLVGSFKNLLFIFIAIANTLIAIINEVRAKKTVDKMKLLSEQNPTVIRDGKPRQIPQTQIVEGDLLIYSLGNQIVVDSRVEEGQIEVNEAFITGEQESVTKKVGDKLTSGSFVVSGTCKATATAVGSANYLAKLEQTAHTIKSDKSKLFTIMNNIVKYISFALIPIGILLLWSRFRVSGTTPEVAVTSTVAALINMIPEGLILLTSSVLALATIRLSKKKVLVQDFYSIETLARVDCIALDKTGTLTTGKMTVKDLIPAKNVSKNDLENALKLILSTQNADNATSVALKKKFLKTGKFKPKEQIKEIIPFSSERKYSGVVTKNYTYLMGAPEFLSVKTPDFDSRFRVIAVVRSEKWDKVDAAMWSKGYKDSAKAARSVPAGHAAAATLSQSTLLGYVLLEDELRKDAKKIIDYFDQNNVTVKIISGDNLNTVKNIAKLSGVKGAEQGIDLSAIEKPNYSELVKDYTIFARVKPAEKKFLIAALKKQGNTVAMTGDGVNDILAMKEADCSIAIGEGSDAARRSAKLVLLNSDFSAVPSIIDEGRQTINNLELSTTLFLTKTIYASVLAVLFVFVSIDYPYNPVAMTLLNFLCIGLPAFVLALEKNTARVKDQFVKNIQRYSVPTGIAVAVSMLALSIFAHFSDLPRADFVTLSAVITFAIDFFLVYRISRPLNFLRRTLLIVILGLMLLALFSPISRDFFDFSNPFILL